MKTCIKCGVSKTLDQFGRHKQKTDGLRAYCKPCNNAEARAWTAANPEKQAAQSRRWAAENPERSRAIKAASYDKHRERYSTERAAQRAVDPVPNRQRARAWAVANPHRALLNATKYRERHPDRIAQTQRNFYLRNTDKVRTWGERWRANNPAKVRAIWMRRAAMKLNATPKWLTAIQKAQIEEFYEIAEARSVQTGVAHHVDHIHPLRGSNFRGLHVPWNLQVLTAADNLQKAARLIEVP